MIIPARGTTVRPSNGKICRPTITSNPTAAAEPIAQNATTAIPGTSGTRQRTVIVATTTITTTHATATPTGRSALSTKASTAPTARSWTRARVAAHRIDRSMPSAFAHEIPTAMRTNTSEVARPTHPMSVSTTAAVMRAPPRSGRRPRG